jgi:hypothetical protein
MIRTENPDCLALGCDWDWWTESCTCGLSHTVRVCARCLTPPVDWFYGSDCRPDQADPDQADPGQADPGQAWFWDPDWHAGEQRASQQIAAGGLPVWEDRATLLAELTGIDTAGGDDGGAVA